MGLLLGLIILTGCRTGNKSITDSPNNASVPAANGDYFQEIGQQIGLDFVHSLGGPELLNIVESSCGGTAFLDYDQDGYIDIYVTSGTWIEGFSKSEKPEKMPHNHLYRNKGNGTFEDVTKKAGVGGPGTAWVFRLGIMTMTDIPIFTFATMVIMSCTEIKATVHSPMLPNVPKWPENIHVVSEPCGWIMTTTATWIFMLAIILNLIRIISITMLPTVSLPHGL